MLLLVAVISVITATMLERLTLATRLAANAGTLDQARAYAMAAEQVASVRIADLRAADATRTTLRGNWQGTPQTLPVGGATVVARVTDGGNCFNLNSLVAGDDASGMAVRLVGVAQFVGLMQALDINGGVATNIANAAADWIDTDAIPLPGGAEDTTYLAAPVPYRTPNRMMTDPSELRVVAGMTSQIYARLRPWICALPISDPSPINVNTLPPERAPLLAMLIPGRLSVGAARGLIAQRPADGYESAATFWAQPALGGLVPDGEARDQIRVMTRWFRVNIAVTVGSTDMNEVALFDADASPARLIRRQWGEDS